MNQASVSASDQADPNPLNDDETAAVNALANADIRVSKAVSNAAPSVGTTITYTVAATNLGPSDATSVDVVRRPAGGREFRLGRCRRLVSTTRRTGSGPSAHSRKRVPRS